MEEMVYEVVYAGSMGAGIGCLLGFVVLVLDYVFTSIYSMMKGGV